MNPSPVGIPAASNHGRSPQATEREILQCLQQWQASPDLEIDECRSETVASITRWMQDQDPTLYISNFSLTDLPEVIGNLSTLNHLFLDENLLSTLPSSFSNLQELKSLNLSGNEFSLIPEVLNQLPLGLEVDLSYNTHLCEVDLDHLSTTTSLSLFSSSVSNISASQASPLVSLDIRNNPLRDIAGLMHLGNLRHIELSIEMLSEIFSQTLESLLTGNQLSEYERSLPFSIIIQSSETGEITNIRLGREHAPAILELTRTGNLNLQNLQACGGILLENRGIEEYSDDEDITDGDGGYISDEDDLSEIGNPPLNFDALSGLLGGTEAAVGLSGRWFQWAEAAEVQAFNQLLTRLPNALPMQSPAAQQFIQNQIAYVLNALMSNEELSTEINSQAIEGLEACSDRAALVWNNIQLAILVNTMKAEGRTTEMDFLKLGIGVFRQLTLDQFAMQYAQTLANQSEALHQPHDPATHAEHQESTEIVLGFRYALGQYLDLPIPVPQMLYGAIANIGLDQQQTAAECLQRLHEALTFLKQYIHAALAKCSELLQSQLSALAGISLPPDSENHQHLSILSAQESALRESATALENSVAQIEEVLKRSIMGILTEAQQVHLTNELGVADASLKYVQTLCGQTSIPFPEYAQQAYTYISTARQAIATGMGREIRKKAITTVLQAEQDIKNVAHTIVDQFPAWSEHLDSHPELDSLKEKLYKELEQVDMTNSDPEASGLNTQQYQDIMLSFKEKFENSVQNWKYEYTHNILFAQSRAAAS